MTLMSDGDYQNYVTSSGFNQGQGMMDDDLINPDTLRKPELIHYEQNALPENTMFRNNLFAWLKQTRILAINIRMFDPYNSHSYRQEELSENPVLHPTMRFPSYYKHFPGFPAYPVLGESPPIITAQDRIERNQRDLDTMNAALEPQFTLRHPSQFIGQSLYLMLSSVAAYNAYKTILNDAIRDIPYTERTLREDAEFTRISISEPEFIARNQSNLNRHAGILEAWDMGDILDTLSFYLNDLPPGSDKYRKLVVSSDYLWTDSVTTRQIDSKHLQLDTSLFEDLTGYDFTEHLNARYDDDNDEQQNYGDWLDEQKEDFDWGDAVSEYPVTATYTGLANLLYHYYGPNAEQNSEKRRIAGIPHAFETPKTQTRRNGVSQLSYGLLYHNPVFMGWPGQFYQPSLPADDDRYNDMLHNTEYTSNSVMWTNYYLARDPYTFLIIEDHDDLITELSSTNGFTFSIPVNFLNFLRYPPKTLKKTTF